MHSLVAGGSGFIGSHLVDSLLDRGDTVVVIDNYITGRRCNLEHRHADAQLTIVEGDISSTDDITRVGLGFDRIYHLASPASPIGYGRHPLETMRTNSAGTWNLLDLARETNARFLVTSTSEIYGDPLVHPQHEGYWGNVNPVGPRSCYDEGKRFTESLTMTYGQYHGLDFRIARLFNTYGPRMDPDDGRIIPNFCTQALRGEPLSIYGNGSQTRSLCYVSDMVSALQALMETQDQSGEVFNLGNPDEYTVLEIAKEILVLTGSRSSLDCRPLPIDDPMRRRPDISKAVKHLEWLPFISLKAGLTQTLKSFTHMLLLEEKSIPGSLAMSQEQGLS